MKKSLIALAALAATTGAFAQSSVTLYGIVDLAVAKSTDKVGDLKTSKTGLQNLVNGNRFGLRGTEDLGSGLKANFTLEYQVNPDETTQAMTNRQGFVGLSGSFGEVRLGRQYTTVYEADGMYDMTNNVGGHTFTTVGNTMNMADRARASNAITYKSNNYSGFSGAAQYAFGETTTSPKTSNDLNGYVNYANGPLSVGAAFERVAKSAAADGYGTYNSISGATTRNIFGGTTAVLGAADKAFTLSDLAASYDFGMVKVSGQYFAVKEGIKKANGLYLGAAAPLGAVTVSGSFTSNGKIKSDGAKTAKFDGYQLMAAYGLSKRTTAYALFAGDKIDFVDATPDLKRTQYGVGVRHTF
jgi:predicted porin